MTSGPGTGQPTVTLTYSYDQLGDETSVTDSLSSQGITTYTFDNAQQMTGITTSYGGTAGPQVSFSYDNGGRLTYTSRQVGNGGMAHSGQHDRTYDAANRVVTMTDGVYAFSGFGWNTTPLATQVYSYDNANRVTSEKDAEGTATLHLRQRQRIDRRDRLAERVVQLRPQWQPDRHRLQHDGHERDGHVAGNDVYV